LLEEKRDLRRLALIADWEHPVLLHGPGFGTAFAANNRPMDAGQIERTQVFQQRFDG
jgi:hypothetical protein